MTCKANLKGIGTAISLYKSDSDQKFPLLFDTGDPYRPVGINSAAETMPLLRAKTQNQAAMQNVWPLIAGQFVTEAAFKCRSDKRYEERTKTLRKVLGENANLRPYKYGWTSPRQFSLGIHYPYMAPEPNMDDHGTTVWNPAYLDAELDGSFVIMADKNPGPGGAGARGVGDLVDGVILKPSNHPRDGEAFLTFSGSADWKQSTEDSKINGDCIYSIDNTVTPGGSGNSDPTTPKDLNDQYIVPHPKDTGN